MVKDVFRVHWYWKRYTSADDTEGTKVQKELETLLEQRKQARKNSKSYDFGSFKLSAESSKNDLATKESSKSIMARTKGLEKTA